MDPLNVQVLESLRAMTSGDKRIDDLNDNVARHIIGILRKYEEAMTRIDGKKKHFTPAGLHEEIEKAKADAVRELQELDVKASWLDDIEEIQKKFDVVQDKSDLQILVEEGRQREVRSLMRECIGDDKLAFAKTFGEKIAAGDPTIVQAIVSSPIDIYVEPELLKIGVEKMRLRQNPAAAQRLETLQAAQEIYLDMLNLAKREIGVEPEPEMTFNIG